MSVATYHYRHARARRMAEAPAVPATPAGAPKIIGFWCLPFHDSYYLKLKINEAYTVDDHRQVQVFKGSRIEAAWAVLANLGLLDQYFPWLKETLNTGIKLWGQDVFTNDQNQHHEEAIDKLEQVLIKHDWVWVVAHNSTAYVGYNGYLPPYGRMLAAEIINGHPQKPTNVRVSGITDIVGVVNGNTARPVRAEEFFKLKSHGIQPAQAFIELAKQFGVTSRIGPTEDPAQDAQAVKEMVDELADKLKAEKTPEILQRKELINKAITQDPKGFTDQIVKHYRAVAKQPEGEKVDLAVHKIMLLIGKYGGQPDADDWANPDLRYLAKFIAPDGVNIDDKRVDKLMEILALKLRPQDLHTLSQLIDSYKAAIRAAGMHSSPVGSPPPATAPKVPTPATPPTPARPAAAMPGPKKGSRAKTDPNQMRMSFESLIQEASFRALYNATNANGLYKHGGMRKIVGADASGQSVTHWIFDPAVPGRVANSRFVVTRPPSPTVGPDGVPMVKYNFKSRPDRSTTGLRALGYIKFLPAGRGRPRTEIDRDVHVYCSCPDFKYRWHKALADAGAAATPTGIGGEATNQDPVVTNPEKKLALCKHLCAMHDYLGQKKADYAAAIAGPSRVSKTGKSVVPMGVDRPQKIKQNAVVSKRGAAPPPNP